MALLQAFRSTIRSQLQASHGCGTTVGRSCALRAFASTTAAALPSTGPCSLQFRSAAVAPASIKKTSTEASVPMQKASTEASSKASANKMRSVSTRALKPVLRDPDRPMRPATPWISFLADFRKQIKASGAPKPSKPTEVMKEASVKWKALSPFDRVKYDAPYEAAKKAYDAKFKAYVDSGKKDAWSRDPARPKAPLGSYLRFVQQMRPKYAQLKMTDQVKKIAAEWKILPADKRLPYEKAYASEKVQFDKDMKAYKEAGHEEKWLKKVGIADKLDKEKAAKEMAQAKAKAAKEKAKSELVKTKTAAAKAKSVKTTAVAAKAKSAKTTADARTQKEKTESNISADAAKREVTVSKTVNKA